MNLPFPHENVFEIEPYAGNHNGILMAKLPLLRIGFLMNMMATTAHTVIKSGIKVVTLLTVRPGH